MKMVLKNKDLVFKRKLILISGGAIDGYVLLDTGYNFVLYYCNFKLRANESDNDELKPQ